MNDYSIDKIKLSFLCRQEFIQDIMANLGASSNCSSYMTSKLTSCRYNYNMHVQNPYTEANVYVGVEPNWVNNNIDAKRTLIIEYNPNKVEVEQNNEYLNCVHRLSEYQCKVMSMDIAYDMDIPYECLTMGKRDVREYQASLGHSRVETRYLGDLGDAHIKLYNKAKEQGIKDKDWSRFEYTIKDITDVNISREKFTERIKLPKIISQKSQMVMDDVVKRDVDRLVLMQLASDMTLLSIIKDRRTRKRYEDMLVKTSNVIEISKDRMYDAFDGWRKDFFRKAV